MRATAAAAAEDCFAQFDDAFARLEADLVTPGPRPVKRVPAGSDKDFAEYDEAFSALDQHLAAHSIPQDRATAAPVAATAPAPRLAAVPAPSPSPRPEPVAMALPATGSAIAHTNLSDELWRRPQGAGTPLERLVDTIQNLLLIQRAINTRSTRIADRIGYDAVAEVFVEARQLCVEFDLDSARVRADFAVAALEGEHLETLSGEIGQLVRHMRHDLQSCSIWPIAKTRMWSFSLSLPAPVTTAFPSAAAEVTEGGRCFGFASYNASVFHMLRAAAPGVRALIRAASKRGGAETASDSSRAIALGEERLREAEAWQPGAARTAAIDFWSSAVNQVRLLQDAGRRLENGTTAFEEHQALHVCHTTRDLLTLLADRVTETQARPLAKKDFA